MAIGIFLYVLAIILGLTFGVFQHVPNQSKAIGIIDNLEHKRYYSDEDTPTYTAVVAYIVEGVVYHVKSSYRSSSFEEKKKIIVYYNRKVPQQSFIRTQNEIYIFIVTIIVIGTILIIKGILNI